MSANWRRRSSGSRRRRSHDRCAGESSVAIDLVRGGGGAAGAGAARESGAGAVLDLAERVGEVSGAVRGAGWGRRTDGAAGAGADRGGTGSGDVGGTGRGGGD